ncbi:hypothetical protein [Candidatus Protochlamydia amoebophila]|uniref:Uncharacterized protein n=1 Tax=Protochlamydia amoebophila (strain UWE25) TaxID=264201 RepID=Q6MEC1_PARUW|nr:hypothetical protein [Candidatus Protochlamydia amoebophila]CAF23078.1 unnamed protein product [Candidatus Protochlamydia amoebophila UWE25]
MFDYQLFLAFPISEAYFYQLLQISEPVRNLFIQEIEGEYLQQITYQKKIYLGKNVGHSVELEKLEFIQNHIFSLLKRLVSDYPYHEQSLVVLAIPQNECSS